MEENHSNTSSELLKLNADGSATSLLINKRPTVDELRKNFRATPSSALSRVRDFLPQMAAANNDLRMKIEQDPDFSPDIEHIDDEESPHIQMTLALVEQEDSDSNEESGIDSDDDINYGAVTEHNIKLPNHPKSLQSPLITTINLETNKAAEDSKTNKTREDSESNKTTVDSETNINTVESVSKNKNVDSDTNTPIDEIMDT